jgi:hypothetical protein
LKYLTRAHWGARPPIKTKPIGHNLKGVVIHYAGFNIDIDRDPAQIAESIQKQHMVGRGWWDIAYSEMVALDGTVVEGRGLLVRSGANGTNSANKDFLAICLLLGPDQTPTPEMIQSVKERIKVIRHFQPNATSIVGHRDCKATDCPGDNAYALVRNGSFQPDSPDIVISDPTLDEQIADLFARVNKLEENVCACVPA